MKLVSEGKLEQLFNIIFDAGMAYQREIDGHRAWDQEDLPTKVSCIEMVLSDCHPEEPLSPDVAKLREAV